MATVTPSRRCAAVPLLACGALMSALGLLGGCSSHDEQGTPAAPKAADLRILAGSELKELEPDIKGAARTVGLTVEVSYSGTLDMVDRINAGESFDAILPPNGAYPVLALTRKPLAREKLFYSRVALGVKSSKARALGWDRRAPTWSDVVQAVKEHKLVYAMTNPTSSNTGMSALFAVASAIAKKTEDLSADEVDRDDLVSQADFVAATAQGIVWPVLASEFYLMDDDERAAGYPAVASGTRARVPRTRPRPRRRGSLPRTGACHRSRVAWSTRARAGTLRPHGPGPADARPGSSGRWWVPW